MLALLLAVAMQCPDGSPPPCGRGAAIARPVLDPHKVAVLPFRVTTSDTLLGEGFAELLATQFTGEGSPRAVDMATVLSAWRHAGGGLRAPLPRARAVSLGRELGAGLVSEGSIVGLGSRVTVTAALVAVPGGEVRGQAEPVSGPADSLDALLRRTTTALLAAIGGQSSAGAAVHFTDSPEAMRAYLEGLSDWRRGRLDSAGAAFDRANASDSSFAQAWFRRYLAANWGIGATGPYTRQAWNRRAGLSARERAILETLLGTNYPAPRVAEERAAARRRLVAEYPDSPDAWYFLGDWYFHYGQVIDPEHNIAIARDALERSAAIDSQATVLAHLVWAGLILHDTTLLRRTWPALDRTDESERWMFGWLVGASTGDAALLATLRRRPIEHAADFEAIQGAIAGRSTLLPARLLDEMFERWIAAVPTSTERGLVQLFQGIALADRGRPAAAMAAWQSVPGPLLQGRARMQIELALAGQGAGINVEAAERALAAAGDSAACELAVWRTSRGDTAHADPEQFRRSSPRCARALDIVSAGLSTAPDADARLAALDSAVRNSLSTAATLPYESVVLSQAWERRGNAARALAAWRYNIFADFGKATVGRLALLAGDTATAVAAWKRYLELTADAEETIRPARDSVRAALDQLHR